MTEMPAIFTGPAVYHDAFVEGLERMLAEHQQLGVFILVLANASFDPAIYARLQTPLAARFAELAEQLRADLLAGRSSAHAPDDLMVFLKLLAVGLDALPPTQFRQAGQFELQFNLLRSFRPPRMADACVSELQQAFNPQGFHFNKPFLAKERLWQGALAGHACQLLYNKFPFAPWHALLVIDPAAEKAQYLNEADHHAVWAICEQLGTGLPGVGLAYNAYGAYASVNHQHFQLFERTQPLPVEQPNWQHNGGNEAYPVVCQRFVDANAAWAMITRLHAAKRPYNLLYRPGCLYVMVRAFQGSYTHADWTGGFAWAELCGALTTFNQDDFATIEPAQILAEYAKLKVEAS